MTRTCSREQIREIDRRAIENYGMPGVVLMENAGRGAADAASRMLADPVLKRAVIFCGKGNNGGDGYVVARHLANRGARVDVVLACPIEGIHPESDAGVNLAIARNMGIRPVVAEDEPGRLQAAGLAKEADLIVDALLGTGLAGEVREPYCSLTRLINAQDKPVLSLDIPSGLDADTGRVLRAAVRAEETATFVMMKHGFLRDEGPNHTGKVAVVDIGVPQEIVDDVLGS